MKRGCFAMAVCFAGVAAQAASLVLEFDAQSAVGFANGARVPSLTAAGSANCTFTPVVPGLGMQYSTGGAVSGWVKAFVFDGTENTAMIGSAPPPSICGNNPWSWEIWVFNPSLDNGYESVFGWTKRDNWIDGNAGDSCMEFRYGAERGIAVEHYGNNVPWGDTIPAAGQWHHVACTFDEFGTERLYVDGILRVQLGRGLRLRNDGRFYLGAVEQLELSPRWAWPFSGAIGKLSIYEGAVSAGKILTDFSAECATYGRVVALEDSVWAGAAGTPLNWTASQNWLGGVVGGGNRVFFENGGVAVLSSAVSQLISFTGYDGGLTINAGAELSSREDVYFGIGAGKTFDFTLTEGAFATGGRLHVGYAGADATVTVGGGAGPATVSARFAAFGRRHDQGGNNGTTAVTLADHADVTVREDWVLMGRYAGGASSLTMQPGSRFTYLGDLGLVVGSWGADGVLTMNGGVMDIRPPARIMMSEADGTAVARLNGGEISVRQFFDNGAAASKIYFNGTLLRSPNTDGIGDYFQNVKNLYLMPGNAVLEVANNWTMGVRQAFTDAPGMSGGIVKLGSGFLRLYGTNDFTGPMSVEGGGLFLQGDTPLPGTYAGSVSVTNNAIIALQRAGGAGQLASLMGPQCVGRLGLFAANAQDTIDLSGLPYMTLEPLENFTFTGTLYPYDNNFTVALSNNFTFAGTLSDLPGNPGRITLPAGMPPQMALTLASSNGISGLVLIEGSIVHVEDPHALGTGPITLRNGAALCFNAPSITGSVAAGIIGRITQDSYGALLLGPDCAGLSLNLSGHPGLYVGARPLTLAYTGTLTPDGTTYRLGGGLQSEFSGERGLEVNYLADGPGGIARGVEVGLPGMAFLKGNNTYSGKTRLTGGGIAYLFEDSGLGTPPPALVPDHLTLDGGVLRVGGDARININANRGVTVTPNGGTIHVWGGAHINLYSPLAGSGTFSLTDGGATRLCSAANTFTGDVFLNLAINGTTYLDIGNGANFSWVSTQPIWGVGNGGWVTLNNNNNAAFPSPLQEAMGLCKAGSGVLTLAAGASTYTFGTRIENGTLQYGAADAIPHGAGRRNVHLFENTALDVNGYAATLNGLMGVGAVINSAGTALTLTVGDGDESSVFTGTLAAGLRYRKIGAGTHADFGAGTVASPQVEAGTLAVSDMRRLQGAPLLTGAAALGLRTFNGLPGDFVDQAYTPVEWDGNISVHLDTLDALNGLLDNAPSALHVNSATLGPVFNYGDNGQFFPDKYAFGATDNFVARWRGKFYAPAPGDYLFATASDDGSAVWIDGQKVVNNNYLQGWNVPGRRSGSVWLAKGHHDITIAFFECGGSQGLTVWGGAASGLPLGSISILPQAFLDSGEPLTPDGILANTLTVPVTGGAGTRIEKDGLPTLIVASDNSATFGGLWAVHSGEARAVDGGAFGGTGAAVDAGATLAFDYSGNALYAGSVSGQGALRHAGAGTLTLTGRNTYTGGTIIDRGTLRVEHPGTLGGGQLTVNGTLELAFQGTVAQSDVMPVTTATGTGEILLLSGTLIADTLTSSTVPVRVAPGATYIAATPNPSVVTLEGGTGIFGNSDMQITGFDDPSRWQANGAAGWVSPGVARVTSTVPDAGTGTLILKEPINAALPWEASFTYTMAGTTTGDPADGFSMFIHNSAAGAGAVGGGATGSGVNGIPSAFGFILNIYPGCNPFFRFCWVENGGLLNETKTADLNGIEPRWGDTQVHVTHDGAGLLTVTLAQNGNTYTTSRAFNIPAQLAGMTGWFGFGGGIGGCNADQQISSMRLFAALPRTQPLGDGGRWAFNGSARLIAPGTAQLTPLSGGTGSMYMREKIDLTKMWTLSLRYYLENRGDNSADGISIFAHNDPRGLGTLGGGGGGRGHTGITPQAGITINIYEQNYFAWLTDGGESGRVNTPNGIRPVDGNLYVTLGYDGAGLLAVILRQGNNVWGDTRAIDLTAALGAPDAWLGISGATGGVTADQRVTDVAFTYWKPDYMYSAYATAINVKAGGTASTLYGNQHPPEANADTLTLWNGALLDIYANPQLTPDTPYAVTFRDVILHGASRVNMHSNGTGAGVLAFSDLHVEAGSSVKMTGPVAFPGDTLTVHAPPDMPRGFHLLADFSEATGVTQGTTFLLADGPPRAKLVFRNGRLYLNLVSGTVLILR